MLTAILTFIAAFIVITLLLWWFLLRPWPFEGNFTDRFNSLFHQKEVPAQVVETKKRMKLSLLLQKKNRACRKEAKDPVVEENEKQQSLKLSKMKRQRLLKRKQKLMH